MRPKQSYADKLKRSIKGQSLADLGVKIYDLPKLAVQQGCAQRRKGGGRAQERVLSLGPQEDPAMGPTSTGAAGQVAPEHPEPAQQTTTVRRLVQANQVQCQ